MAQLNFDPNQYEPIKPFELIPGGWYGMHIVASEVKNTKAKDGQYLELEYEMLEAMHPDLKGRKVWDRLNMWNQNQQAVDIANRILSAICKAVGVTGEIKDTSVLHGKPIAVKIKVRPARDGYDATNEVAGYKAMAEQFTPGAPVGAPTMTPPPPSQVAPPPQQQAPPQQQQVAPPPQGQPGDVSTPPWQK